MNTVLPVNIKSLPTARLGQAFADKLRELLGQIAWLHGTEVKTPGPSSHFDLLATLPLAGGRQATLCMVCKSELRPSLFAQLTRQKTSVPFESKIVVRVLALPWVSPRIAELCAENGWSWFDLAGNHRLDIPGLLHLERTGNPPVHVRSRPTANLGTPEAGRVIRALLLPENAARGWTQREMQKHCQPTVSLGLVNKVVRHLRDEAFLEETETGLFLRDPLKLLFAWREAYRFDRHEQRGYFTLLSGKKLGVALANLGSQAEGFALYASFSAAEFQAPHVRQPKIWLYVRSSELSKMEPLLEAKPVDSGENLVVLIPEDEGVFHPSDAGGKGEARLACTNAVQTYVDLWHSGGRGQEAAEALLEQKLKPEWKKRGMKT